MTRTRSRRAFLARSFVVGCSAMVLGVTLLGLMGCNKKMPWEKKKRSTPAAATVEVPHQTSVLTALRHATSITTRQTSFGTEIVGVDGQMAKKGTGQDDGFVVLRNGAWLSRAIDEEFLFTGTHVIEVRYVPFGVHGSNGTTVLTVTAHAQ